MIELVPETYGTRRARDSVARATTAEVAELAPHVAVVAGDHAERLAAAVREHAGRVLATVLFELDAPALAGGMLVWDARFAGYLETLGETGAALAGRIRTRSSERWLSADGTQLALYHGESWPVGGAQRRRAQVWSPPELWWLWDEPADASPPRWFLALAEAVWLGEVKPAIEREAARKLPMLALPFAADLARARRATPTPAGLVDDQGRPSPLVLVSGPGDLSALARRGLDSLDTPIADRLFGWLLALGAELEAEDPLRPANMYSRRFVGGYSAIAAHLGVESRGRVSAEVAALVAALGEVWLGWDVPGVGNGRPLPLVHVRDEQRRAPGRPESFVLGLSPLWTPKLAPALSGSERLLVPWLPLPDLDGVNSRHQRAAVLLWRAVRVEVRLQAAKLGRGGVALDWLELGRVAGLPDPVIPLLVERWTGEAGPLVVEGNGVDVRDPVLRAALVEGGARQLRNQARGKASARKRKPRKRTT